MVPNTTSIIIFIMPPLKRQSCPVVDFMITSVINHIDSRLVLRRIVKALTRENRGIV
jgi:hypothetical protein